MKTCAIALRDTIASRVPGYQLIAMAHWEPSGCKFYSRRLSGEA